MTTPALVWNPSDPMFGTQPSDPESAKNERQLRRGFWDSKALDADAIGIEAGPRLGTGWDGGTDR
jgi:hypothetical protein